MVIVPHINLGILIHGFKCVPFSVLLLLAFPSGLLRSFVIVPSFLEITLCYIQYFFLSLLFCSSETLFSALFSLSINRSWAVCPVVFLVSIFCGFWVFQNLHCSSLLRVVCLIKENLFRNSWTLIILASLPCSSISAILTAVLMLTLSYRIYLLHLSHCFFLHSFVMAKVAAVSLW